MAVICTALVATKAPPCPTEPYESGQPGGPPVYNPYPPGILPPDLDTEIARVRSEIRTIFGRYVVQWRALTSLTYSNTQGLGNPPTLAGLRL